MRIRISSARVSLAFTSMSFLLGATNILVGRRVDYLEYLPLFNAMAVTMLGLVLVGLIAAIVALAKARGRGASPWLSATFASLVLATYLLDQ